MLLCFIPTDLRNFIFFSKIVYANSAEEVAHFGFDDKFFYEELAKDPEHRKVKMIHEPRQEGVDRFKEWLASNNAKMY